MELHYDEIHTEKKTHKDADFEGTSELPQKPIYFGN